MDWKDKKIAVLGLGIEGVSSALYLRKHGASVTVLDRNDEARSRLSSFWGVEATPESVRQAQDKSDAGQAVRRPELTAEWASMTMLTGKNYLDSLDQYDIIVRSPGIKLKAVEQALDSSGARKKGVVITSQTKLFFDLCPCPIIGVTGTKGKGTTSALIYEMLKKNGFDAYLGGNIGKPTFDFLDNLTTQSKVVLEMSSFQLQDLTISPHIGVVLMITSEHLDYHKDVYEYIDAKRNIIRFQTNTDFAVINRDYITSNESDNHTAGKVFHVSRERVVEQGAFVKDKAVWLRHNGKEQKIIDAENILLPGAHNLENVCASVMAATLCGVSKENIISVLKTFKGLEHRLELIGEIKGVRYYDDSFSTTPETAIAAIQAFRAPEILILGGSSKNSDFSELGKVISEAKNIKVIIGIGSEWSKIKESINTSDGGRLSLRSHDSSEVEQGKIILIEGAKDMHEIVGQVASVAEPGDVVLLSPACASFDMFKNYKDRGEQFKREVSLLSVSS